MTEAVGWAPTDTSIKATLLYLPITHAQNLLSGAEGLEPTASFPWECPWPCTEHHMSRGLLRPRSLAWQPCFLFWWDPQKRDGSVCVCVCVCACYRTCVEGRRNSPEAIQTLYLPLGFKHWTWAVRLSSKYLNHWAISMTPFLSFLLPFFLPL